MELPIQDPQACDELQDVLLFISRQTAQRHAETPCAVLLTTPIGTEPKTSPVIGLEYGLEYGSAPDLAVDEPRSDRRNYDTASDVILGDNLQSLLRRRQVSFWALRGDAQGQLLTCHPCLEIKRQYGCVIIEC